MSEEPTNMPAKNEQSTFSKAVELAAYPLAIGTGIYTFNQSVDNKLWDRLKKIEAVDEVIGLTDNYKKELKDTGFSDLPNKMAKYHPEWTARYKEVLKGRGFNNIVDKLKGIHPEQRNEAIVLAFTMATVAFGACIALANGKQMFDGLFSDDKHNTR